MAQDFSMRVPLIDARAISARGRRYAAAMRYTESRLTKIAQALLDDIDKDTVDFQANYDDAIASRRFCREVSEPAGQRRRRIAVGMATNIPPHNLGEVIDACVALIDNPALSIDELIDIIPGPDFPTGASSRRQGIRSAYHLGPARS